MKWIKIILTIIDILCLMSMIYYVIIALFVFKKKSKLNDAKPTKKFAVLIPARNEGIVIGNLLDSLEIQNYPKELYDVYVLPNNCYDNTEEIAKQKNAKIIDCQNMIIKSKGDVLRNAFKSLEDFDYDAYIIFDADNVVHPDFIKNMNNSFCAGNKIAQGYRDSKNPTDSWVSSAYSIHYMVQNYFVNRARMNLGISSFINGTGFMISKEIIDEQGYCSKTMTEDIELNAKCALNNEKIAFVDEAITYDEQPVKFMDSWKQRKRWSIGTNQCLKLYSKQLVSDSIKNKKLVPFDNITFLMAPAMQLISTFNCILHFIINAFGDKEVNYIAKLFLLMICYMGSLILGLYMIKVNKKDVKTYIKGVVFLPLFYLSWIPININALFDKNSKWERIEHKKILNLDNIIKFRYINNGVNAEK